MLDFLQKKAAKKSENLQFWIKKYYFELYDLSGQGKIKWNCLLPFDLKIVLF
jgi:hypothetical protein